MKLFTLFTLVLALTPKASLATVYDENTLADEQLTVVGEAIVGGNEPQLTSTHDDLSRARIVAVINKSPIGSTSQIMRVYVDGNLAYEWKVSTGREKKEIAKSGRKYTTTTPIGYYRPTKLELNHYSQTWKADMPHAVFFNGGIAIHASTHLDQLGTRASGGCVRLAPKNAKTFFELVKSLKPTVVQKINRQGRNLIDQQGNPITTTNYDVLIIVENHA